MGRKRNERIYVMVTEKEKADIIQKMKNAGMNNLGEFIRLSVSEKPVINVDINVIARLLYELNKIGVNLNQIAKTANITQGFYPTDIEEIKNCINAINSMIDKLNIGIKKYLKGA